MSNELVNKSMKRGILDDRRTVYRVPHQPDPRLVPEVRRPARRRARPRPSHILLKSQKVLSVGLPHASGTALCHFVHALPTRRYRTEP